MICACGCGKEFSLTNNRRRYWNHNCQARDWQRKHTADPAYRDSKRDYARLERLRVRRITLSAMPSVVCPHCRHRFKRSRKDQVYCSKKCQKAAWYARRRVRGD